MNLHMLKSRLHLLVGLLITLVAISPAQTSDIVCPGSWKQVSSSGPAPRAGNDLAFEPRGPRGQVVLFGGFDFSSRLGDTWTWDGTVWIHAADAGPSRRSGSAIAYDFANRRIVLFGGYAASGDQQDTWAWNGTKWTEVAAGGSPPARNSHGMAYDGVRKKVVLFGGGVAGGVIFDDTWEWDGTAWSQRSPVSAPSPRGAVGMAYDGAHARTVLFGGGVFAKDSSDTWTWDGTVWTQVATTGPSARHDMGMTYDSARHRTVLFGGGTSTNQDLADTWEWDGVRWTQVASTGPPARGAPAMAYDKARGKAVLFGGVSDALGVALQDTWEWTGPIYGCSNRAAGDLNCDRHVDRRDLTILTSALALPACAAGDPRDLNQDGKINAQDAQLLVNHCTTLGCK